MKNEYIVWVIVRESEYTTSDLLGVFSNIYLAHKFVDSLEDKHGIYVLASEIDAYFRGNADKTAYFIGRT